MIGRLIASILVAGLLLGSFGYLPAQEYNIGTIIFEGDGSYPDEVYISPNDNGVDSYRVNGNEVKFSMPKSMEYGMYYVLYRYGTDWYKNKIYVRAGENKVKLNRLYSYGIDIDKLRKEKDDCGCDSIVVVQDGRRSIVDAKAILHSNVFDYYLIIVFEEDDPRRSVKISDLCKSKFGSDKIGVAVVSRKHWRVADDVSKGDGDVFLYNKYGKLISTWKYESDELIPEQVERALSGNIIPGDNKLSWILIAAALILLFIWLRKKD